MGANGQETERSLITFTLVFYWASIAFLLALMETECHMDILLNTVKSRRSENQVTSLVMCFFSISFAPDKQCCRISVMINVVLSIINYLMWSFGHFLLINV